MLGTLDVEKNVNQEKTAAPIRATAGKANSQKPHAPRVAFRSTKHHEVFVRASELPGDLSMMVGVGGGIAPRMRIVSFNGHRSGCVYRLQYNG